MSGAAADAPLGTPGPAPGPAGIAAPPVPADAAERGADAATARARTNSPRASLPVPRGPPSPFSPAGPSATPAVAPRYEAPAAGQAPRAGEDSRWQPRVPGRPPDTSALGVGAIDVADGSSSEAASPSDGDLPESARTLRAELLEEADYWAAFSRDPDWGHPPQVPAAEARSAPQVEVDLDTPGQPLLGPPAPGQGPAATAAVLDAFQAGADATERDVDSEQARERAILFRTRLLLGAPVSPGAERPHLDSSEAPLHRRTRLADRQPVASPDRGVGPTTGCLSRGEAAGSDPNTPAGPAGMCDDSRLGATSEGSLGRVGPPAASPESMRTPSAGGGRQAGPVPAGPAWLTQSPARDDGAHRSAYAGSPTISPTLPFIYAEPAAGAQHEAPRGDSRSASTAVRTGDAASYAVTGTPGTSAPAAVTCGITGPLPGAQEHGPPGGLTSAQRPAGPGGTPTGTYRDGNGHPSQAASMPPGPGLWAAGPCSGPPLDQRSQIRDLAAPETLDDCPAAGNPPVFPPAPSDMDVSMRDASSPGSPITVVPGSDGDDAGGPMGACADPGGEDGVTTSGQYDVLSYRTELSKLLAHGHLPTFTWTAILVPFIYGTTCPDRALALRGVHYDLGIPDDAITFMADWWRSVGVATPHQAHTFIRAAAYLPELVTLARDYPQPYQGYGSLGVFAYVEPPHARVALAPEPGRAVPPCRHWRQAAAR